MSLRRLNLCIILAVCSISCSARPVKKSIVLPKPCIDSAEFRRCTGLSPNTCKTVIVRYHCYDIKEIH